MLASILTGRSYATSAELAHELGAFPGFDANRESMLRVIRNHAAAGQVFDRYEGLSIEPPKLDIELLPSELIRARTTPGWMPTRPGSRRASGNAQVSVIAPTGPSVSSWTATPPASSPTSPGQVQELAGGGSFRIINQAVPGALSALGYGANEQAEI